MDKPLGVYTLKPGVYIFEKHNVFGTVFCFCMDLFKVLIE